MKLMAWFDRRTPRDLYDLAALERLVPRSVESSWQAELGHQASSLSSPSDCLDRVRLALDRLDG